MHAFACVGVWDRVFIIQPEPQRTAVPPDVGPGFPKFSSLNGNSSVGSTELKATARGAFLGKTTENLGYQP